MSPFAQWGAPLGLMKSPPKFPLCSDAVETLGIARSLAWKVHIQCADGYREGTKSIRRCVYRQQLDIDTLVCTRGPNSRFRVWSRA